MFCGGSWSTSWATIFDPGPRALLITCDRSYKTIFGRNLDFLKIIEKYFVLLHEVYNNAILCKSTL